MTTHSRCVAKVEELIANHSGASDEYQICQNADLGLLALRAVLERHELVETFVYIPNEPMPRMLCKCRAHNCDEVAVIAKTLGVGVL